MLMSIIAIEFSMQFQKILFVATFLIIKDQRSSELDAGVWIWNMLCHNHNQLRLELLFDDDEYLSRTLAKKHSNIRIRCFLYSKLILENQLIVTETCQIR